MWNISDPDKCIANKIRSLPQNIKLAFVSALSFSLLVHGIVFINKFVNEDTILGLYWAREVNTIYLGRWFIPVLNSITRINYSVPWIIGVFAISSLVAAVMVIISVLEIKSGLFVVVASMLIVSFPTLSRQFGYDYEATTYTFSLLFAVCAIYLTKKYRLGFIAGALCLMLSLALYQSYFGFAIGLCIIIMVKHVLNENITIKNIMSHGVRYLSCGILGMAAYLVSVRLSLVIMGMELTAYRGIDTMGRVPLNMLPSLILRSYSSFILFFSRGGGFFHVSDSLYYLYIAALLLAVGFLAYLIIMKKIHKAPVRLMMLGLLLLIMPLGLNITDVLAPETRAGVLNVHPFVLVFILVLILCEVCVSLGKPSNLKFLSKWMILVVVFLISKSYMQDSGLYYFKLHIYYQRTYAFYNRVLTRIEQVEGFRRDMSIAAIGNLDVPVAFTPSPRQFPTIVNDQGLWGQFVGVNQDHSYKMVQFFSDYLGMRFRVATTEQFAQIKAHEDFLNMPVWPHSDSVAVIDDIIVVRLNYTQPVVIEQLAGGLHLIRNGLTSLSEDYLFSWQVFREDESVHFIWYERGLMSFEYEFSEHGRYLVRMSVRTLDNKPLMPAVSSDYFVFEP